MQLVLLVNSYRKIREIARERERDRQRERESAGSAYISTYIYICISTHTQALNPIEP